jgi:hypothetical protein
MEKIVVFPPPKKKNIRDFVPIFLVEKMKKMCWKREILVKISKKKKKKKKSPFYSLDET